jgi:hypothetical protein
VKSHLIVWEHNHYEQIGEGEVGWILKGTTTFEGKTTNVYLPLRKIKDGHYSAGRATIMGNAAIFVGYGDVGHKAEDFAHIPAKERV